MWNKPERLALPGSPPGAWVGKGLSVAPHGASSAALLGATWFGGGRRGDGGQKSSEDAGWRMEMEDRGWVMESCG